MNLHDKFSRAEVEFSVRWIQENPELFNSHFNRFAAECKARGWNITSRARSGFLTFIGSPEARPEDMA